MGNRKSTTKRGRTQSGEELNAIVEGIAHALKLRIVVLPKSTHHYHSAIWSAFDGDFGLLEHALERLKLHASNFGNDEKAPKVLQKWRASMKDSYEGNFYVLSMFHQLLTEYYRSHHGRLNPLSEIFDWRHGKQHNQNSRQPRAADIYYLERS